MNYSFTLYNDISLPIFKIHILTSRNQIKNNKVILGIRSYFRNPEKLIDITKYVNEQLEGLQAELKTAYSNDAYRGFPCMYREQDKMPDHIVVTSTHARQVIDTLFFRREMSLGERTIIEDALRELENSTRLAQIHRPLPWWF